MTELGFENGSATFEQSWELVGSGTSSWIERLDNTFCAGDPIVRGWFLVRQTLLPPILCLCYALFSTRLGPALMRDRAPFDLRNAMVAFNFGVVAAYIVCVAVNLIYLPRQEWEVFCYGAPVVPGTSTYKLAFSMWCIYILKYVEFLDTVFFVLRKKQSQITLLHVFHHSVVPIVGWILMRMENSGMFFLPVLINAVVHIVMYTYYGLAAMGPSVRKYLWWKKYLTQLQMVQFIVMVFIVVVAIPATGCTGKEISCSLTIVLALFFLYLFYQFYRSTFKKKLQ